MKIDNNLIEKVLLTTVFWACSFIGVPMFVYLATGWQWAVGLVLYYFFTDWLVSITLHHAHSHKDWEPPSWWTKIALYLSAALGHGTPLTWSAWHRYHHRTSETPDDPHSPRYDSFFWIVFCVYWHKYDLRTSPDWLKNREVVWISLHQGKISLLVTILLLWLLPFTWFLAIWAFPLAMSNIGSSIGHAIIGHWGAFWNDRGGNDTLRDTLWIFPFAFSGYMHKTHHTTLGMPAGRWAITTRVIKLLAPNRIKRLVNE